MEKLRPKNPRAFFIGVLAIVLPSTPSGLNLKSQNKKFSQKSIYSFI